MSSQRNIDQLTDAIEAHGYFVSAEPIPGQEELFAQSLRECFTKIESTLTVNAKRYGYRGLSRRALHALHIDLPRPCWLVELAA